MISRSQLKHTFFDEGKGTKQDLAGLLAEWYPEELANRLPPKREIWDSEDSRMDIFDAVAFGVAFSLKS